MIKRAFDLLGSTLGLLVLSPLLFLVTLAVKHDSHGPIFYQGERVGRDGMPFNILKFRTMEETSQAHTGPRITAAGDPRVTDVGRFLRDSKLNELPQLVNVLKGEMSLVGPRPEDPTFVEHYSNEQREVLTVRPGITSLASVIYAGEEKMLSGESPAETYLRKILPDKLRLDLIYVRNQSFLLDLDILFRTFVILIPRFRKATLHAEDILLGPFRLMRRLVTWFSIDAAIAAIAVILAGTVWRLAEPLNLGLLRAAVAALSIAGAFTLMNTLTGLQKVQWRYASAGESVGLFFSVLVATVLLLAINAYVPPPRIPPGMLIVAAVFALGGFVGVRYRRKLLGGARASMRRGGLVKSVANERVIVVGAGDAGQLMIWLLQNSPAASVYQVVGVVDDDYRKIGTLLHGVPILGTSGRLTDFVEEYDVGCILFAIHSIDQARRLQILERCRQTRARTIVAPDLLSFLVRDEASGQDGDLWDSSADYDGHGHEPLRTDELAGAIHRLADLARAGDYARVTELVLRLDQRVSDRKPNPAPGASDRGTARTSRPAASA